MTGTFDLRPIFLVTGVLLATLGAAMLLAAFADLVADNADWQVFVGSSFATILVGGSLFAATRGRTGGLSTRQAMLMTVSVWVALVAFGALPYHWSGVVPSYTDAFFESMSGLTTTGATVIVGLDDAPPGILLWRAIQQWLGGLGIIVMAVSVLPMLQIGGMQVFRAEAFDTPEKILPRARQISGAMTRVFVAATALCALLYWLAGMGSGDAIVHAMTTVATGGFSSKDASIGHFDSAAIDAIAVVFMIVGSIPFLLYVAVLNRQPVSVLWRDSQVRVFLTVLAVAIAIAWAIAVGGDHADPLLALRYAAFNVTSLITGTGYATTDYGLWGGHSVAFFFVIMFIGGCAGSTSCGIKIFRFQVLFQELRQHINATVYPHGLFVKRFNGRPIDARVSASVMSFFFLYIVSFFAIALLLRMVGLDFTTAMSGAGSAISNVGPGLGDIIGPAGNYAPLDPASKWILSFAMLLGRLELFTVLVLFLPRFWRG